MDRQSTAIRRHRSHRPSWVGERPSPALRYAAIAAVASVLLIAAELAYHLLRTPSRDPQAIAARELTLNTLQKGENVVVQTPIISRGPGEDFRSIQGLLVLTNERLILLSVQPRDLLSQPDAPPRIDIRDHAVDTTVSVTSGRAMLGVMHGLIVRWPAGGTTRLGIPSSSWKNALIILDSVDVRQAAVRREGARLHALALAAEAHRRDSIIEWRKPRYYTVQRGDAISSIATKWNTTPEQLEAWNHLDGPKIRAGQVLLVRPRQ